MARELGIPAVIGAVGALEEIPNGAEVEVDPVAGTVQVLVAQ
jgi:phosphohistidine swiveling domain-containing protein